MKLYSVDEATGVWVAQYQKRPTQSEAPVTPQLLDTLLHQDALTEPAETQESVDCFARALALVEQAKVLPLPASRHDDDVPIRWFWWPHEADQAGALYRH